MTMCLPLVKLINQNEQHESYNNDELSNVHDTDNTCEQSLNNCSETCNESSSETARTCESHDVFFDDQIDFSVKAFEQILTGQLSTVDRVFCDVDVCKRPVIPGLKNCTDHLVPDKANQHILKFCKARYKDFSFCNQLINLAHAFYYFEPDQANRNEFGAIEGDECKRLRDDLSLNLCEEHLVKAKSVQNSLRAATANNKKAAYILRSEEKRARKLARVEARKVKLERRLGKDGNNQRKKACVSATVRLWKKRRRRQPRMIQTGGKSLQNAMYRPYPDYDWGYSTSQSSSPGSCFDESFCQSDDNTIQTFSANLRTTDSQPTTPLEASPDNDLIATCESRNFFGESSNAVGFQTGRPPEPLTPELSDGSFQGLQLPGCLDSPSFLTPFDSQDNLSLDDGFSDSLEKFMSGMFDVLSPSESELDAPGKCPPSEGHFDTCNERSETVSENASGSVGKLESGNSNEALKLKDNQNFCANSECLMQEDTLKEPVAENIEQISTSDDVTGDAASKAKVCRMFELLDHDYSSFTCHSGTQSDCLKTRSYKATIDTIHPNKWLDVPLIVEAVETKEQANHTDKTPVKSDPILCQPKADSSNVVRVKFRAPIVERGLDPHFGCVPRAVSKRCLGRKLNKSRQRQKSSDVM